MILFFAKFIARIFGVDTTTAQFYVIGIFCVLGLFVFGFLMSRCESCAIRRTERQIDRQDSKIENANVGLQIINQAAQNANNDSRNAEREVEAIKNANYSNTNADVLRRKAEKFEQR